MARTRAVGGHISLGDIAMAFQATEQGRSALAQLFRRGGTFYEHLLFAKNLFDFLDLNPNSVEGALARDGRSGNAPPTVGEGIEFRGVGFRYPGSDRAVLADLSFALKPGKTVAVVGANGAGKTTLVKLLARLYDPTAGEIRVDGIDLRDIDPEKWQREIGVIFQDFARYDLSVRENIGFGDQDFHRIPPPSV